MTEEEKKAAADKAAVDKAAADKAAAAKSGAKSGPKTVEMHRAVHELQTGKDDDSKILAGTLITDDVAKAHKLDSKALDRLIETGAVDLVEVLKD
ncbi:hypothetical protein GGQ80_002082 [Sphingomonas jinjuensis]|uniref:Uncharacterized protein n=1 Tax=Sphingomonas jinjuensis TaxID=535907 RepID=A0A840FBZ8_9SPHN|nr:hypothetical protein [Sphingomonas jinjuensis]MBB4154172.1 hypothetical protein [Sphingomonas jinjuensis]